MARGQWIHEGYMRKAVGRLYGLGNKPYRGGKSEMENFAGAALGALSGAIPDKKVQGPKGDNDTSGADPEDVKAIQGSDSPFRQDVEFIKGNNPNSAAYSPEYMQEEHFRQQMIPTPNGPVPEDPFRVAAAQQKTAEAATMAPVNGKWTQAGSEQHKKNVDNQAADLETSRRLMGGGVVLRGMGGSARYPENL